MVGGGQVAVFDPKSRDEPLRFPLRHSPLSLVLERTVDLAQRDMVVAHFEAESQTAVTLQDPENPDYGFIQLIFTDNPDAAAPMGRARQFRRPNPYRFRQFDPRRKAVECVVQHPTRDAKTQGMRRVGQWALQLPSGSRVPRFPPRGVSILSNFPDCWNSCGV